MSYAVVRFIKESDKEEVVVSEVPIGWLSMDHKKCKWPPNNSHIYISKNRPAADSWTEYDVEVEYICDTLLDAKLKASCCSSDEEGRMRGKGCRAPKPLKTYSPPEISRKKDLSCLPPLMEDGYADYFVKNFNNLIAVDIEQNEHSPEEFIESNLMTMESYSSSEATSDTNTSTAADEDTTITTVACDSKSTQTVNMEATTTVDLRPLLDSIIRTQVEHSICLEEIKQIMINKTENEAESANVPFNYSLPCDTLESLEGLEIYAKDHSSQFIKLIQKIGGNDGRDYTSRSLKSIYTNNLGELCSWTGQKSNFAVNNLRITELIFDVVHKKCNTTKKEFEFYVKEWFRHSKQRRERDDRRK